MSLANNPHCEWDRYKRYSWTNIKNILGKFKKTKTNIKKSVNSEPCRRPSLWMTRKLRADNRLHVVVHRVLLIERYVLLFACRVFVLRMMYFCFSYVLYICVACYVLVLYIMYFLLYTAYFNYRGCFVQNIWPSPFSAPKSQLELFLHEIVYLREPLVCSLTYFILCTFWC